MINFWWKSLSRWLTFSHFSFWNEGSGAPWRITLKSTTLNHIIGCIFYREVRRAFYSHSPGGANTTMATDKHRDKNHEYWEMSLDKQLSECSSIVWTVWESVKLAVASPGSFTWGYRPGGLGDGTQLGVHCKGEAPLASLGDKFPRKLKQLADIVHRFWLQKLSIFENFTHFTSWILTSVFHSGRRGKRHFWGLAP